VSAQQCKTDVGRAVNRQVRRCHGFQSPLPYDPPPQLPLSQRLEAHLRLPSGLSAEGGPIRLWPIQKGIADALADPEVERVTLAKSARGARWSDNWGTITRASPPHCRAGHDEIG
jgi:hypothetical protein